VNVAERELVSRRAATGARHTLVQRMAVISDTTARRSLVSTGAAAEIAGCHPVTVLRAIHRGELEAMRLGRAGRYRITPDALEAWLRPRLSREERTRRH
jgi:excisionase family DNA binding protein